MRYDTVLEELSARPGYLLLVFLVMLLLLHVVLVSWWKLDDITWKRVDYVWLGAAGLGLLAASAQAERVLAERYLIDQRVATASNYSFLRATLANPPGVCVPRTRSDFSPPNFDEIVKEQAQLCEKAREIAARMKPLNDSFPALEQTGYEPVGQGAIHVPDFAREMADIADAYRQQQSRYAILVEAAKQSDAELIFVVIGPLLLSFALALRITKVTGEVRNAQAKLAA